jgi:hypothetical protein
MTQAAIQEQVDAIRAVTENATKSREAAEKFLMAAGIIEEEAKSDKKKKK